MITAVITPAAPTGLRVSATLSGLAMRVVHALVESRMRNAELELRRHDAVIRDLALRYGHGVAQAR